MQKGQTFSEQVKQNLASVYPKKKCCRHALACGMYLASRAFAQNGNLGEKEHLQTMLSRLRTQVDIETIGALFTREMPLSQVLLCPECTSAFFKGVFLSCGSVTDPQYAGSHLEISLILEGVFDLVKEAFAKTPFVPKESHRHHQTYAFYFKSGEEVGDFLNYIGDSKDAFSYIEAKIEKTKRNDANRQTNCDTANIDKMIRSASEQLEAIAFLEARGTLSHLPEPLQKTAQLRREYPDVSLPELARLHEESVSKSGVNHRLQKLIALAAQAREEAHRG